MSSTNIWSTQSSPSFSYLLNFMWFTLHLEDYVLCYLFVSSFEFLQNTEGVVCPLAFAVKFYSPSQAIILHLKKEGNM